MVLFIGGAAQGKTTVAKNRFSLSDSDFLDGATCATEEIFSAKCITHYHLLIRRWMDSGKDPLALTERLCKEHPNGIVLMNEIGCGIIPMEKQERLWRETVGRCGCLLAEHAHTVLRVFCGIPTVLKEESVHG